MLHFNWMKEHLRCLHTYFGDIFVILIGLNYVPAHNASIKNNLKVKSYATQMTRVNDLHL